jgi:outer membrane protein OmpA-like peptidoglycan-associated protein
MSYLCHILQKTKYFKYYSRILGIFIATSSLKSSPMKLTLLLLLLLNSFLLHAKASDFSLIIHKPFNAGLVDITQNYDGTLSVLGFSHDFKQPLHVNKTYTDPFEYLQSLSSKYGSKMQLLTINNKAQIVQSKTINISKFAKPASFVKTPTNGYFIGGYTMDGSQVLLLLNAHMQLLHSAYFGTKNHDTMHKLIALKDGGVLSIGTSFSSRAYQDNIFESGLGNDDICICRFTKDARLLWTKKYGTQNDDEGIDAAEADDGSIIVLSATHNMNKTNVYISRLTQNGDKIWLKEIPSKNTNTPVSLLKLRDNNFVVSLSKTDAMHKKQIRLVKFDTYQNILVDSDIATSYSSQLNDIKEFSDGRLVGVGYVQDAHNTDGLAMIISNNLKLLNQEHYGDENYDVFNKATILANMQVGVAGIHTDNNSNENNMWIVKLNKDATMAQIAVNTQDFYTQLCKLFQNEIHKKQLIIKKDLTIEFTDKSLYFRAGEYRLNEKQKKFFDNFSKKLITFLYTHKMQINTLEINGHTSSEWKNASFSDKFLNNENLSMKRSYETLKSLFLAQDKTKQKYLTKILKGSGLNYKERIIINNQENREKSRRVSLKIILN